MHNRNFSASAITQRRMEKAIAGSFFSAQTREACPKIKDSSFLYQVRSGQMTQYSKYTGGCIGVSPGCPCSELNASTVDGGFVPTLPGAVSGIVYTVGSIVVSWITPRTGTGPFRYVVTPFKNGVAEESVETNQNSYRFINVEEGATYRFTVCAKNDFGVGPAVEAPTSMVAPPHQLTDALEGTGEIVDALPSIRYMVACGLESVLAYVVAKGLGPTAAARLIYLWSASMAQAWNWVSAEVFVVGTIDQWNWSAKSPSGPLSPRQLICWMCTVMDVVTPAVLSDSSYRSLFPFSEPMVQAVQAAGQWYSWLSAWSAWWSARQADGASEVLAAEAQPVDWPNASQTVVVDGVTVNPIDSYPAPQEWTALAVQGKRQKYLTYRWREVRSTCLSASDETAIEAGVAPLTGGARDSEVDVVLGLAAALTDEQKVAAEFWAGGPGTVTPPLMLAWMWKEYVRLGASPLDCSKVIYSLLDLAIHLLESSRMVWGLKTLFREARPIQEIRRRYAGQAVSSWSGSVDGSQWVPYQEANFVSPPFADFPSGHSAFSKSFALVMEKWFGAAIEKSAMRYHQLVQLSPLFRGVAEGEQSLFGDFVIPSGASLVQTGAVPAAPVTLSFSTWSEIADSAGMSRLYGGIHCLTAHQGSQRLAVQLHSALQVGWGIPTEGLMVAPPPSPAPVPSEPEPVPSPVPSDPEPIPSPSDPEPVPVPAPVPSDPEPVPVPAPVPSDPEPVPVPVPVPSDPEPVPVPAPVPSEPEPVPAPVPVPSPPSTPYTIHVNYVSQMPSASVQGLITDSIVWIQRLMLRSHGLRLPSVSLEADMVVDVDIQPLAQGILAGARPTVWNTAPLSAGMPAMPLRQSVTLNSNALNSGSLLSSCLLNGQVVMKLVPVMIHEMLHGLGVASLPSTTDQVGWGSFLDASRTWYIGHQGGTAGSKAIQAYQAIVGGQVSRIPVENSFGQGTAYSHWEEGMRDGFVSETRTYDYGSGLIAHPALPNEIMTGIAGTEFYLTPLTAGALLDYGYPVDEASSAIMAYPSV